MRQPLKRFPSLPKNALLSVDIEDTTTKEAQSMNVWKFLKYLLGLGLILGMKLPGILYLAGAVILVGGTVCLVRQKMQHRPVLPVLLGTLCVPGLLFLGAHLLPDIRVFELLYF